MLDDRVPHPWLGAGYPRAKTILDTLSNLGHKIGFIPCIQSETRKEARRSLPERCRYLPQKNEAELAHFVEQHAHRYDVLWISRPHNMATLQRYLPEQHAVWRNYSLVVYDAEALFAPRAREMARIYPSMPTGKPLVAELGLTDVADVITVVSANDQSIFERRNKQTVLLTMAFENKPTENNLDERRGFLFVGTLREHPSPNSDALYWFVNNVAPLLREELAGEFQLNVAGMTGPSFVLDQARPDVRLLGTVPDLTACYRSHRVFISPHRLAAGIPTKILESAAHGLPAVAPDLLSSQLGWRDRVQLVTARDESPSSFAEACLSLYQDNALWKATRDASLKSIHENYSQSEFSRAIQQVLAIKSS